MNISIIYDSYFGNTEKVVLTIEKELKTNHKISLINVKKIKNISFKEVNLCIFASPTRAFSPTKEITIFISKIYKKEFQNMNFVVFDTRINLDTIDNKFLKFLVSIFGYANKKLSSKLSKKGGKLVKTPEFFYVEDSEGPLAQGEIERAKMWARSLISN